MHHFPSSHRNRLHARMMAQKGNQIGIIEMYRAPMQLTQHIRSSNNTLTTWDDFQACGVSKSKISDMYKTSFSNTTPDAIHLNDSFTNQYGWDSFNILGDTIVENQSISPMFSVAYSQYTRNEDPQETISPAFTLTASHEKSATVSVSQTSSIGYQQTITIGAPELGLGSEFSTSFNITNESGSSSTTSTTLTISQLAQPRVPPLSKVLVTFKLLWTSNTCTWRIPIRIDPYGLTGAQFPKAVPPTSGGSKHYHWALYNNSFGDLRSEMRGKMDASYDIQGLMTYGAPEPL